VSEAKHLGQRETWLIGADMLRPVGCYEKLRPFVTLPAPG